MQTAAMAKDKTFNLRLDEKDRERLDAVAEHYSAPAATVVRILIKEKYDALRSRMDDAQVETAIAEFKSDLAAVPKSKARTPEHLLRALDVIRAKRAAAKPTKKPAKR